MTGISTHVLDTALGRPAPGIDVRLETRDEHNWISLATSVTDADGRCRDFPTDLPAGLYRLIFATADYFHEQGRKSIYPEISVTFDFHGDVHYHLPVLLSDNSYTTYRGS